MRVWLALLVVVAGCAAPSTQTTDTAPPGQHLTATFHRDCMEYRTFANVPKSMYTLPDGFSWFDADPSGTLGFEVLWAVGCAGSQELWHGLAVQSPDNRYDWNIYVLAMSTSNATDAAEYRMWGVDVRNGSFVFTPAATAAPMSRLDATLDGTPFTAQWSLAEGPHGGLAQRFWLKPSGGMRPYVVALESIARYDQRRPGSGTFQAGTGGPPWLSSTEVVQADAVTHSPGLYNATAAAAD